MRWLTLGSGRTNHERVSSVEARLGAKGAVHQLAQVGHSAARLLRHAIALVGRDAGRTTHFPEGVRTLPRQDLTGGVIRRTSLPVGVVGDKPFPSIRAREVALRAPVARARDFVVCTKRAILLTGCAMFVR